MEEINQQLESKSIERTDIKEVVKEVKPKKTRSEAQKNAFEKARKKREENLSRKKEEAKLVQWAEDEVDKEMPKVPDIKPPPKKRGRPKKVKEEPRAPNFIPPPVGEIGAGQYPIQGQQYFNPYQYLMPQPQQQAPAPVNNYYYYGAPPDRSDNKITEPTPQPTPQPAPEPQHTEQAFSDDDEIAEYEDYGNEVESNLKYRFA